MNSLGNMSFPRILGNKEFWEFTKFTRYGPPPIHAPKGQNVIWFCFWVHGNCSKELADVSVWIQYGDTTWVIFLQLLRRSWLMNLARTRLVIGGWATGWSCSRLWLTLCIIFCYHWLGTCFVVPVLFFQNMFLARSKPSMFPHVWSRLWIVVVVVASTINANIQAWISFSLSLLLFVSL